MLQQRREQQREAVEHQPPEALILPTQLLSTHPSTVCALPVRRNGTFVRSSKRCSHIPEESMFPPRLGSRGGGPVRRRVPADPELDVPVHPLQLRGGWLARHDPAKREPSGRSLSGGKDDEDTGALTARLSRVEAESGTPPPSWRMPPSQCSHAAAARAYSPSRKISTHIFCGPGSFSHHRGEPGWGRAGAASRRGACSRAPERCCLEAEPVARRGLRQGRFLVSDNGELSSVSRLRLASNRALLRALARSHEGDDLNSRAPPRSRNVAVTLALYISTPNV